jgi:hypothetical protein
MWPLEAAVGPVVLEPPDGGWSAPQIHLIEGVVEPCRGARWVRTVLASVLPEILEPIGCHFGVANRVHDIFMAHIVLEGSGVVAIVGELVTSGVPEHVRVNREWELGSFSGPSDHLQESRGRGWTTSLGDEDISSFHILPM